MCVQFYKGSYKIFPCVVLTILSPGVCSSGVVRLNVKNVLKYIIRTTVTTENMCPHMGYKLQRRFVLFVPSLSVETKMG